MGALDYLDDAIAELSLEQLLRDPEAPEPSAEFVNASSNDYLGLALENVSRETLATSSARIGAGASPLVFGRAAEHRLLERELADWLNAPDALLFSSGYAANVGALSALAGQGDVIISDALNHASIIDGCRLSRAEVRVYPHCDLRAAESLLRTSRAAARRILVTESYFSMDADGPDLRALSELCDAEHAVLYVDEAHALGLYGPEGAGLCLEAGVQPHVLVGTLGKAVGVHGAFVAGSRSLRTWLWNRARSHVFSTGTSPLLAELSRCNVRRVRRAAAERARIQRLAAELVATLRQAGLDVPASARGHIIPIIVGDNARALAMAARLRDAGYLVQAIRPPTVPPGTARLRVTLSTALSDAQYSELAGQLIRAWSVAGAGAYAPAAQP